ncbi:MAG: hypothetical protein HY043_13650 [Verrucomicrobia bacterium]|nr:hypothetical protein [Verrucomicrobiota bacterium]
MDQRYENGTEIRVGDEVSYNGQKGKIVIVVDRDEYAPSFPKSEWPLPDEPTGFMIEFTNGARLFLDSSDEHLEVLSHREVR